MKLKSLLLVCCLGLVSSAFAATRHVHPQADTKGASQSATKDARFPGYCEIEIINRSYDAVIISGQFDDYSSLDPFVIERYGYDAPHTISLYYGGYCHAGMLRLNINTVYGYNLYSAYTPVNSTIEILPYFANANKLKVEIHAK